MAADYSRDVTEQDADRRRLPATAPADPVYAWAGGGAGALQTAPALLGHTSLGARGNAPVRAAALQRLQQAHGNRAVQRFLQRHMDGAAVQREAASPDEEEEELPVQTMRALPIQRCGATPCNCSAEERVAHAQEESGGL